jgi:hypothetical protein
MSRPLPVIELRSSGSSSQMKSSNRREVLRDD